MPFTCEENCLIKFVGQKNDEAQHVFVKNFQTVSSVKELLCKIGKTNLPERKVDSRQPQTVSVNRVSIDMKFKKATLDLAKSKRNCKSNSNIATEW